MVPMHLEICALFIYFWGVCVAIDNLLFRHRIATTLDTSGRNYYLQNPLKMDVTEGNRINPIKLGSERQLLDVFSQSCSPLS